jgi:hypothetical protein
MGLGLGIGEGRNVVNYEFMQVKFFSVSAVLDSGLPNGSKVAVGVDRGYPGLDLNAVEIVLDPVGFKSY